MNEVRLHSSIHLNDVILKRRENSTGNREFLDKDNFTHNQGLRPINRIAYSIVTHYIDLGLLQKRSGELIHNHNGPCVNLGNTVKRIQMTAEMLVMRLTFVCPCSVSITVNDDQQDATILACLFIPNQLYMFRAMSSPIIRST